MYCAITGETHCKCLNPQVKISALKIDLRATMRKLFTDHAVLTSMVLKSIVSQLDDTNILLERLLLNQKDIGDQLKPIIGNAKGNELTKLLTEHIKLAGEVIKAAVKKDPKLQTKINQLYRNSDDVAAFLTLLNEEKLPYEVTQEMFRMHNEFVIKMTLARISKDYKKEQQLYDAYYNEMLELSDAIFNAL